MLRSLIVIFSLYIVSFGADIDFSIEKSCYSVGDSMTLKAVYTGSGSVTAVQWTYTDQIGSNLFVLASTCDVAAIVQGFPERSRMTFDCDLTTNTFTLTLKDLKKEEFDKTWGATFSLSVGGSPAVQEKNFTFCLSHTTPNGSSTNYPNISYTVPPSQVTTTRSSNKNEKAILGFTVGGVIFVGGISSIIIYKIVKRKRMMKYKRKSSIADNQCEQTSKTPQNPAYKL